MVRFKILIVDEQKDDLDAFKDYVDLSIDGNKFEIITSYPEPILDEMIEKIFSINPDAVITDYMLNEIKEHIDYNVPYNGVELVEKLLSIRTSFPCFVMTYFDDTAVKESDDVNLIYVKNILHGSEKESVKATFLERLENQIVHYKSKIENSEKRLLELIALRKAGKTSAIEESEMIELDHFIESAINKQSAIPQEFKELSNTKRLEDILSKMDELLKKIEKK